MSRLRLMTRVVLSVVVALSPLSHSVTSPLSHLPAYGAVPHLIRYQGQAVDANGVPLEGPYTLTFRLYGAETGGTALWQEIQANISLEGGHFSVLLGQVTTLDSVDWTQPLWLGVQVNTEAELAPRQRITSVPLAITAERLAIPVTTSTIVDDAKALVPVGAIILWDGASCPAGYARLSTYDGKFLVGSATAGQNGGSNTHSHGVGTYAGTATATAQLGSGTTAGGGDPSPGHTHPVTITGTSGSTDSRPEFRTVLLCQRQ